MNLKRSSRGEGLESPKPQRRSMETPSTPPSIPWRDLVKSCRQRSKQDDKRVRSVSRSPGRRQSLRLRAAAAGGELELSPVKSHNENSINDKIRHRMKDFQRIDQRKRKSLHPQSPVSKLQLKTPPQSPSRRPSYNLMNGESVTRKFIDDMASAHLADGTEPGCPELMLRTDSHVLRRVLTFDD